MLRAHLINNCNAPVEWLQGVFARPIDFLQRKSWRTIARCRMEGEEDGEQPLEKCKSGLPPGSEVHPLWVNSGVGAGNFSLISATKRYVAKEPTTIHLQNCQFFQSE